MYTAPGSGFSGLPFFMAIFRHDCGLGFFSLRIPEVVKNSSFLHRNQRFPGFQKKVSPEIREFPEPQSCLNIGTVLIVSN